MISSKQGWKNWVPIKLEPLCPVIPFSTFPIYSEKSFHSIYIALSVILNSPYHSKVRMLAFMCEICRHKGNEEGCCLNLISFAAIKSSDKSASRRNGLLGSRLSSRTAGEVKVVGVLGHPHQERGDEFLLACLPAWAQLTSSCFCTVVARENVPITVQRSFHLIEQSSTVMLTGNII